jgi:hypothetical protein
MKISIKILNIIALSLIISPAYAHISLPAAVGGYQPPTITYPEDRAKANMTYAPVTICIGSETVEDVVNRFPNAAIIIMEDCSKIKVEQNKDGSINIK